MAAAELRAPRSADYAPVGAAPPDEPTEARGVSAASCCARVAARCGAAAARCRALNFNVKLVLLFTLFENATKSLFLRQIFANWVFIKENSHTTVGYAAGINGLALLVLAFPVGWAADRFRRHSVLAAGGVVACVSIAFSCYAFLHESWWSVYLISLLWGVHAALTNAPLEALFADAVPPLRRSGIFAVKHSLLLFSSSLGPFLSVGLFYFMGDRWDPAVLERVLTIGTVLAIVPAISLFFFDDERAARDAQRELAESQAAPVTAEREQARVVDGETASAAVELSTRTALDKDESSAPASGAEASIAVAATVGTASEGGPESRLASLWRTLRSEAAVAYVLAGVDVVTAVGAGMTVQFFPVFFLEVAGLSPIQVSLTYALCTVGGACSTLIAQKVSLRVGRVYAILLFRLGGILSLFVVAYVHQGLVVALVFVVRTAMMNSARPIIRSILMDCVPESSRGRWNSWESVTGFTWSGSAALGGLLIDRYSYRVCFVVTALIYSVASLPLLLIASSVRSEVARSVPIEEDEAPRSAPAYKVLGVARGEGEEDGCEAEEEKQEQVVAEQDAAGLLLGEVSEGDRAAAPEGAAPPASSA